VKLLETTWTEAVILRITGVLVLLLLMLLSNVVVIAIIVSRAELSSEYPPTEQEQVRINDSQMTCFVSSGRKTLMLKLHFCDLLGISKLCNKSTTSCTISVCFTTSCKAI